MNHNIPAYVKYRDSFKFNYRSEFEEILDELGIKPKDTIIIGSTSLYLAGIRENEDVDFLVLPSIRKRLYDKGINYLKLGGKVMLSKQQRYGFLGLSDEELIKNDKYHILVDGFKIIRLEIELSKKYAFGRPKDIEDIKAIEDSGVIGSEGWDWELVKPLPPWERPGEQDEPLWKLFITSLKRSGFNATFWRSLAFICRHCFRLFKDGNMEWVKQLGLTDSQVEESENQKRETCEEESMTFYGIIWPTAEDIFEEVENYLSGRVNVIRSRDYQINSGLKEFIRDLYKVDSRVANWRIEKMIHAIGRDQGTIRVLVLEVPSPELERRFSGTISRRINTLKTECRKKFQNEIDNYVYDNILYISDNRKHNIHIKNILSSINNGYYRNAH